MASSSDDWFARAGDNYRFRYLFCFLWSHCAGWDRVVFGDRQFRHFLTGSKIRLSAASLGELDAVTIAMDDIYYIALNNRFCPWARSPEEPIEPDRLLHNKLSNRARFVLLHEISHILVHSAEQDLWVKQKNSELGDSHWIAESGLLQHSGADHDINTRAVMREVEADFLALLSLIPDVEMYRLARDRGALNADTVARYLCDDSDLKIPGMGAYIWELAKYRIWLFKNFARRFLAVSREPFARDERSAHYRRVMTVNCQTPEAYKRTAKELERWYASQEEDDKGHGFADIPRFHPRVRYDDTIREAMDNGDCQVFPTLSLLTDMYPPELWCPPGASWATDTVESALT